MMLCSQQQGIVPAQAILLFIPTCFGLWECYKMRWSDPVLKSYKTFFFPITCRRCFSQRWPIFFSARCQWISHGLPSPGPAWRRLSASGRSVGLDSNIPVLVRGEQDGFYYHGTVKEESEVSACCCAVAAGVCDRVSCPLAVLMHHLNLV